ncbi:Ig-like domain-containing protein [Clostridium sp. C8-1-8]|uniref:Ig-like domain-containing protein n=1 Tax=Clostridium sp. C8-1-8 TaxID=2698831 RepID=UPI00136A7D19|nr:Ig-like domain-containing protein [Clostridium sp. C8-1-8]
MLKSKTKIMMLIATAAISYNVMHTTKVKAEGTKDMVKNGGYRAYTEWTSNDTYASIPRQTKLNVFVNAGETINLGSSVIVSNPDKDYEIYVTKPDGTRTGYHVDKATGLGYIDSYQKESAGPNPGSGGYTPITIKADTSGVWKVEFRGSGKHADDPTEDGYYDSTGKATDKSGVGWDAKSVRAISSSIQKVTDDFVSAQGNTIGAWDITVKDMTGNERKGRVFTSYVSLFVGKNSTTNDTAKNATTAVHVIDSDFYVLTKDGYVYKTSMNGLDPNGFLFFSNNRGFVDKTSNMTLYHSVAEDTTAAGVDRTSNTLKHILGNVSPQRPDVPDTATDITHNVFFNYPSQDLPSNLSPQAIAPAVPQNFNFTGNTGTQSKTQLSNGGTFSFVADKASSYRLVIDTDGTGGFNLATDKVIENVCVAGKNTVTWDGTDKSGKKLPVGSYSAHLIMKGGEYHFPMLDAEHNPFGIKVQLMNAPGYANPNNYTDKYKVYYDESNYTTSNNTTVNLDAGNTKYNINPISALNGIDSSNGANAYFQSFGDVKGIDTWTYFPGQAVDLTFEVTPTVSDFSKSGNEDTNIAFVATDFINKFQAGTTNNLSKIKVTSLPSNGQLNLNGTAVTLNQEISVEDLGGLVFVPNKDWNGSANFDWIGSNGVIYSANNAKVNITITPVNDAPIAVDDVAKTNEKLPVIIKVLDNDSDVDGDLLHITSVTSPLFGKAFVNLDGTITYTPNLGYHGADAFTYTITDGNGVTTTAKVNVSVNALPVGENYDKKVEFNTPLTDKVVSTDADGDKLAYSKENDPSNGTVMVNEDGTWTYTPNKDFSGADSFTVKVEDGHGGTAISTISVTVDTPPTVGNYDKNADFNKPVSDKVTATDANGDALTYSKESNPTHGTVVVNNDGTWIYTPDKDFSGADSFTIKVDDGHGGVEISTVSVTVDTPPAVGNYDKNVDFNKSISDRIIATDANGDALTYSKESNPTHGTVVVNNDGTWTYTPDKDFSGADSFTVKVDDGHGGVEISTVSVTVDTPPTVGNYDKNADFNKSVSDKATATDANGDTLSYSKASDPSHGIVVVNEDGTWTYTPNKDFSGADSFTIKVNDGHGGTAISTISVTVNTPPAVGNYDKNVDFNKSVSDKIEATDANGDTLIYSKENDPANGSVVVNEDGAWTYTSNKDFSGADSFTVKVSDGHGGTAISTISVTVDTPPVVSNYDRKADFNKSVSDKITAIDVNEDKLTYSKENDPSHGTVIVNEDGTWTYTPNKNFSGADSFTVKVDDGHGGTAISTISVTVNTPPAVGNYDKNIDFNKSISDRIIATDANGDALAYSKETDPNHGMVVVNNDGTWIYTPDKDFSGADSFTVKVDDGHGGVEISTVSVTVDTPPAVGNYNKNADFNKSVSDKATATDANGDILRYSKASDPTHGIVVVNEDGTWTYTPNEDFSGTDSFTIKVNDGHGGSATSLVMIKVNTPPVAVDDFKAINQDNSVDIDVLGNDSDKDKDLLSVITVSQPQHGKAVVNGDWTITYTPNTGYSGTEDFTYTISDGHNGTATAHVTIKVNAIPMIPSFYKEINVNAELKDKVIASDADIEDVLTFAKASNPSHGSVVVNPDGSYVYTPDTDYVGYDSFTIKVSDNHGGTAISTINVRVNSIPTLTNYYERADFNKAVSDKLMGEDKDGDRLTYSKISDPSHGSVVVNEDGTWTYTPNRDFSGADSFTVKVNDGHGGTSISTISVTVDTPPSVVNYDKSVDFNKSVSDRIIATDANGDTLTYSKETDPSHGTVVVNNDGTWTYTPNKDFSGADSFTVKVNDGHGGTTISTISVTVDTPPAVGNYDKSADFNNSVSDKIVATDANGDILIYSKENDPSHGTVVVNNDGTWTYTPNKDFSGADSFTVKVNDGHGGTAISTISVTVDTPPVVGNYDKNTDFNKSVSDRIIATDANEDTLTYSKENDPSHGSVVVNNDGTWTYTPNKDFSGADSFTVKVNDGHGETAISIVNLKVDSLPIVGNYGEKTDFNKAVSDKVIASDVDGDSLSYSKASDPSNGTVIVNQDGTWTYTPNEDFSGTDSFTVKIEDGHGGSATSLVKIKVNTPPVAVNDFKAINQDNSVDIDVLGNDSDVDKDLLSVITVSQPQHGKAVINGDGTITYTPNSGYSGTEDFTYTISDGHNGTATAHVTIKVNAIPMIPSFYKEINVNAELKDKVIASDADIEDVLTFAKASNPSHGSVVVNPDGSYVYTPDTDYVGYDSFTIKVSDDHGGTAISTINVRVNSIPTLTNYDERADFNKAVSDKLMGEDKDGDRLTYSKISDPSHGSVVVNNDGTWTYTPNKDFSGTDSFTVKVNDGHGGTAMSTISVTVDTPPAVGNYDKSADFNKSVLDRIIATDANGDALTYSKETDPSHGTVVVNNDGTWIYTPNKDFSGADSFTVKVNDGHGGTTISTISVTVDTPPAVGNYNKNTDFNKPVSDKIVATDANGDTLTYSKETDPSHGSVVVNSDGTWTYTPSKDFSGTDSFKVLVNDGHGGTAISIVNLKVDSLPTVGNYGEKTDFNKPVSDKVIASDVDGDSLSYSKASDPSNGTVIVNQDGTWTYTPNEDFSGTDSFKVQAEDGHGGVVTSTITVKVDTPPVAVNDEAKTNESTTVKIDVLSNDTDLDKDSLSIISVTEPQHGKVVVNLDGTISYTPNAGYHGKEFFTYTISDGHNGISTATVSVDVNATPIVGNYEEKTDYNKSVSDKVVASDADGDVLTYSKAGDPSHGTVTVNKDGTWVYTPSKDFSGADSFTVKVEDGKGVSTISTVKIVVDTPPVAINDSITTDEDASVNIDILNNDKDANNDALTVTAVTNPSHGNVAINPDGTVKYTPVTNYNGNDSFTYTISDGHGGTATATVNIIVNPVNDAPTVPNYDKTTPYNKSISSRVQGTDVDGDALQYTLRSQANNGYVIVSSNGTWTYTPNFNYAGSDSFTVEVSDGHGKTAISTINITIRDRADLVGTVRDISTGNVVPNTTIQLSDLAGRLIYTTTTDAQGNYAINNVKLGIYDFRVSNSQFKTINDEFDVEPSSETDYTVRKDFQVSDALTYSLNLTASPNTILGDGISTSVLTTRVVDSNNNPVANVQVNFSADAGNFPNGAVAVTDKDGIAKVVFKSANVSGTEPQKIHVSASVDDKAHNLQAFDQIIMTFEPGVIVGVVIDNDTNQPISNALVEVSKDFDGDGIADFYSKVITGADGKYTIAIPRGNTDYKVEITKPVKVGNTYENVKFTQNNKVGSISGNKTEQYSSEETVAGVILSKQTDGKVAMLKDTSLFSIEVLNKADGSSAGNVKASFVNGVFEAEGLEKGKSYTIAINYTFPSGQRIAIGTANVNVNTDGQINLTSMLIDPYGTITDSITNGIIDGVRVQLYYADTERNRAAGRKPNTLVDLPKVPGFAPADNENPQIDDVNGKYAFMVFPEADYYLVATKDGYDTFVSETISVEKNIVKRDISMNQVKKPTVTTPIVSKPVEPIKETPQPEKTATIIQELPKTGSVVDFNTLSILGLMMVASGVGITLTKKKN